METNLDWHFVEADSPRNPTQHVHPVSVTDVSLLKFPPKICVSEPGLII